MKSLLLDWLHDLQKRWRYLFLTDLLFKLIATLLLTPLVAISLRWFLSMSGKTVLADVDLLYFVLTPIGIACLITVGALYLAITALELATLMGVLACRPEKKSPIFSSLVLALHHSPKILNVSFRIIAKSLLIAAPFLIIAAVVYMLLLTEFDINYYLQEMPPVFQFALAIGGILLAGFAITLIYAISGWLLALPLVMFEHVAPSKALLTSRQRISGSRWSVLIAITSWAVTISLVSSLLTSLIIFLGSTIVESSGNSLEFLTLAIGISLTLSGLVNLAINLIGTTTLASLLFHTYRQIDNPESEKITQLWEAASERRLGKIQITKKSLAILSAVSMVLAASLGFSIAKEVRLDDEVAIIAHRGASAFAPENTLASILRAIDQETDWVEIDVQETADGEVVVFHDSDFMKLAGVNKKIWNVTTEDLNVIDIGSSFSSDFQGERVPTLAQVLQTCKGKVGVNIELKYYGHDQQLERRVIDLVEAERMTDQVMFMSLKMDAVEKMKSLRPDWTIGLLLSVSIGDLKKMDADFLAINASFATRSLIREAHKLGKQVFVWTVNDPVTMAVMMGRGADGVITDKPALARDVLVQRSELNVGERLLLEFAELFGITPEIAEQ